MDNKNKAIELSDVEMAKVVGGGSSEGAPECYQYTPISTPMPFDAPCPTCSWKATCKHFPA